MKKISLSFFLSLLFIGTMTVQAQTELDGIMMNKKQICNALMYGYSSWDHYWEGTLKRTNENLGTVSTQSVMYGANYGITDDLNVMAMVPYIWTKASAGTLHPMEGIQDISVFVKWRAYTKTFGQNKLSFIAIGGISTPLSDYVIDFLPLSIGLGSTNLTGRAMVDYQYKKISVTGSAAYIARSNVKLDRNSYYDTELHLTDEVKMPDVTQYQLRAGYRGKYLLAEALLTIWNTLGGFDMTRNNMPFPSNDMDATMVGGSVKYTLPMHTNLAFTGGVNYTVSGRNVGQATTYNVGALYAFYFKSKKK